MKDKFHIEYSFNNISLNVLWTSVSTPSGLSNWFAEDVSFGENNKTYSFKWGDTVQEAAVIAVRTGHYIRFRWHDEEDVEEKAYFEMKISVDELTGEVSLIITDFAEPDEKEDTINLWNKQIDDLRRNVGL